MRSQYGNAIHWNFPKLLMAKNCMFSWNTISEELLFLNYLWFIEPWFMLSTRNPWRRICGHQFITFQHSWSVQQNNYLSITTSPFFYINKINPHMKKHFFHLLKLCLSYIKVWMVIWRLYVWLKIKEIGEFFFSFLTTLEQGSRSQRCININVCV